MRRSIKASAVGLALAALVATATAGTLTGVASATSTALPVTYNGLVGFGLHSLTPTTPAPGSTLVDWQAAGLPASCHSASHPLPVVLVNGTGENQSDGWNAVSPLLKNNGYCVYTANIGGASQSALLQTVGDIPTTAGQLGEVVDKVLAATGAAKVDLVGHSQGGGVLPRWYLKFDGGAAKVAALVGMAPSNHGVKPAGLAELQSSPLLTQLDAVIGSVAGAAWGQQLAGSTVNLTLDAGGDTVPGVAYTQIISRYDEVVTPYTQQYLVAGPGATVTNELVQDSCGLDFTDHIAIVYDHVADQLVLNALDPAHAKKPVCSFVAPIVGG
jgi:triacylglycerol esterase/lipase EstA (alpha/beta hydrolase family)